MASTGYGLRPRLSFDGDETKFDLWEIKFLAYLCIQKMHVVLEEVNNDNVDPEKLCRPVC